MVKLDLSKIKDNETIFDYQNVDDCLKDNGNNVELIAVLLMCCGFIDFEYRKIGDEINFFARSNNNEEKVFVRFSLYSKILSGDQSNQIRVAYKTVQAIEKKLSEHVLLPPELRKTSVEIVCNNIGITLDQFSSINRNWAAIN